MKPEDQVAALAELDEKLFVIHKPCHDPFGYYRKDARGYCGLAEAWRVTEEVGLKHIGGRPTDYDRVVLEPAPTKDYMNSWDAIIPLIQKQDYETKLRFWNNLQGPRSSEFECGMTILGNIPAQLCEALLRATGMWKE